MDGAHCKHCDAPLPAGARFCTRCGQPVRKLPSQLPWYVAGGAIVALIAVLLLPTLSRSGPGAAANASAAGAAPFADQQAAGATNGQQFGTPPPLTGSPREQADRLYNRIMAANDSGNQQEVTFFLPMGIAAYQQAGDLDADGLFHLSLLQNLAGQADQSLATAKSILASEPDHLLGLAAAAEAADKAGDKQAAAQYYRRFLDAYDKQMASPLPEYKEHSQALTSYRSEAQAYLKAGKAG
jgi:tetratricopeptide (TPR) repeat protein